MEHHGHRNPDRHRTMAEETPCPTCSGGTRTPDEAETGTQGFYVAAHWCNNDTATLAMYCEHCDATVYELNDYSPSDTLTALLDAAEVHSCDLSHDVPDANPQRVH